MCYHVSTPGPKKLIKELPEYKVHYDADNFYHVTGFTRPFLPITTHSKPRTIESAQWKLLPYWVKNEEEATKYANTCNAESESVFEKISYKNYIGKHRGLLWVDGFYEPHHVPGKKETENYYIYLPQRSIFSLGIVIAPWVNKETGECINTFSVLTTKANDLLEKIHNQKKRMPLIIAPNDRDEWLLAEGKEEIQSFMNPFNGVLEGHKVSRVTANRTGLTNNIDSQKEID